MMAPTKAGGVVAILQSVGVLGFGLAGNTLVFCTGGTAGGVVTGYALKLGNETLYDYCNCTCNVSA